MAIRCLDEPRLELMIEEDIESENFKAVCARQTSCKQIAGAERERERERKTENGLVLDDDDDKKKKKKKTKKKKKKKGGGGGAGGKNKF